MTGNQIKGKAFAGALRYNLEKVEKGAAELLDSSFANTKERGVISEVEMMRMLRRTFKSISTIPPSTFRQMKYNECVDETDWPGIFGSK